MNTPTIAFYMTAEDVRKLIAEGIEQDRTAAKVLRETRDILSSTSTVPRLPSLHIERRHVHEDRRARQREHLTNQELLDFADRRNNERRFEKTVLVDVPAAFFKP